MNKLDRVNKGKWWRMEHPDGSTARFIVTVCGVREKTPKNVMMRLEVHGPCVTDHVLTTPTTRTLGEMRLEWDRLAQRGFVYNPQRGFVYNGD